MARTVRIGCASGFYGDSQLSARQLVEKGDIDYLAKITMAILAPLLLSIPIQLPAGLV